MKPSKRNVPATAVVILLGTAVLLTLTMHSRARAQTAAPTTAVLAQPEYHPSLGDLMTMAVQPRHLKLGIAGKEKNWAYAKYELSELRNAFARVARTIPVYRNADLTALMNSLTTEPVKEVDEAIDAAISNVYIANAMRSLRVHLARVRRLAADDTARLQAAAAEHAAIAEAIAVANPRLAEAATMVHLHRSLTHLKAAHSAG